jgi:hypothetical protein
MAVTERIRTMILDRTSATEIRREAARQGMRSLREDGWRLVRDGRTTVEEVLRATKDERYNGSELKEDEAAPSPEGTAKKDSSAAEG